MDNSKHIIREIAMNLSCGEECYFNKKTREVLSFPVSFREMDEDEFLKAFKADLKKVEEQAEDFLKFEVLDGFESFKIMEGFVDGLPESQLRSYLEASLGNKKPFRNFKHRVENSDYRQAWFDYKQQQLESIVRNRSAGFLS